MHEYISHPAGAVPPGSLVVKLYRSGNQIRGYVRKVADIGQDDAIFPGEEMEPEAAFKLAETHRGHAPIFVDLVEDVAWDPSWGRLRH